MFSSKNPPQILVYSALIFVQLCFGLNFVSSKIIVDKIPPVFWGEIRFLSSAFFLFVFLFLTKRPFPKELKKDGDLIKIFFFAIIGVTLPQVGFLYGIYLTGPTNASIISISIPIFTILIATYLKSEQINVFKILGILLALIGVIFLRNIFDFKITEKGLWGDILVLGICFLLSIYFNLGKNFLKKHDHYWVTALLFFFASIQTIPFAFFNMPDFLTISWDQNLIYSMIFSVFAATLFTYFLSNWIMIHVPASHIGLFIYIQPIVAGVFSSYFFNEEITSRKIVCGLLIFLGILLSSSDKLLKEHFKRIKKTSKKRKRLRKIPKR